MRFDLKIGDRQVAVDAASGREGYTVAVDDVVHRPELLHAGPSEVDFRLDGRRRRAFLASRGDERHVFLDGRSYVFRIPADEDDAGDLGGAAGPDVVAQMPGKVVKLLVEVGREVEAGTPLLIMESMKMETEIAAPVAGVVVAVHVRDGQVVGMGEALLDIEPRAEEEG